MRQIQKNFIALLLFILAFMILLTVSAHFYLDYRFPVDTTTITRKLDSDFITSRFKVVEARKAGYADEEIAMHLASEFDKKRIENMTNLIIGEVAIYIICILVGLGLVIIKKDSIGRNQ